MFKIPTHDEIEKSEDVLNTVSKVNDFKIKNFIKRKCDSSFSDAKIFDIQTEPKKIKITDSSFMEFSKDVFNNHNESTDNKVALPRYSYKSDMPLSNSSSMNHLIISSRQKGNPVLKHLINIQWMYSDTLMPDFCMSKNSCAYYISLKYHLLNPTYVHSCIKNLGRAYDLRILLVICDIKETKHCIKELEKMCITSKITFILCWSHEEIAFYLEIFKIYETKSAEFLMDKNTHPSSKDNQFINKYADFLSSIKSINKNDTSTLRQTFGSLKKLSGVIKDDLNLCPGIGFLKVNKLFETFHTPFKL
jgi:DNA excision repair protein ERCC-1